MRYSNSLTPSPTAAKNDVFCEAPIASSTVNASVIAGYNTASEIERSALESGNILPYLWQCGIWTEVELAYHIVCEKATCRSCG